MGSPERIPVAGVGVGIAGVKLAIIGTVINRMILRIALVEPVRKKHAAVERAVESALLFFGAAFDADSSQGFVPAGFGLPADGVKIRASNFLIKVPLSLLRADERGSDSAFDDRISARVKAQVSANVRAFQFGDAGLHRLSGPHAAGGKRTIESEDKIISEIVGNRSAIVAGHADDFVFGGHNFHGGNILAGKKIQNDQAITN